MSAERDELLRLVREIPEDQVPQALADVRSHLRVVREEAWPPAWFGIAERDGSPIASQIDDLLRAGFGR